MSHRSVLLEIYRRLNQSYGAQHWWPADSTFEVMVGAILTQNTSWINVEKAINNLKEVDALNVHSLIELSEEKEFSSVLGSYLDWYKAKVGV